MTTQILYQLLSHRNNYTQTRIHNNNNYYYCIVLLHKYNIRLLV